MVPGACHGSYFSKEKNMALSTKAKKRLEVAMARRAEAQEVIGAIEVPGSTNVADAVAALGATADLSAVAGTYAIPAEPTGAEVDATVQALADEVEARLDDVEAKIDEVIAALKAANLMNS